MSNNIDKGQNKWTWGSKMTWEEYEKKWPQEIEKAQKGLNTPISRGIFVYLLTQGQKTFSEMSKQLEIDPNKLSYHLKNLVKNGLLSHTYAHEEHRQDHSFYEVSNFGNVYAKKCLEAAYYPYQSRVSPVMEIPTPESEESIDTFEISSSVTSVEPPAFYLLEKSSKKEAKKELSVTNPEFTTYEETTKGLIIK